MKKILVTGANGFIGSALCKELVKKKKFVYGTVRKAVDIKEFENIEYKTLGDTKFQTNLTNLLSEVYCVIHCAGIAHVFEKKNSIIKKKYQSINVDATRNLAIQSAKAGVKRMIFLSSIKVNGENTYEKELHTFCNNENKTIFTHIDQPAPKDFYGLSKLEAENELLKVSAQSNLEVSVLRLPLVYGKGAKGNLKRLLNLINLGIPLPFGMIKNQRSMIGIDNLIDLIIRCIDHPAAADKIFLVSDGEDLSTPEFLRQIAFYMKRNINLFRVPVPLLKLVAKILNRNEEINKLIGSLKVDSFYTQKTLDWSPPISVSEGIRRMVSVNKQ